MVERLKLRARDAADMDVLAALLQDAIVPLGEMDYLPRERRFVLVLNRFMWERAEAAPQTPARDQSKLPTNGGEDARFEDERRVEARNWRSHCGLIFDRVKAVATRNLPRGRRSALLNLLTVASEPRRITFHFSGGAQLRLDVAEIRCHLEDLGDPWPASDRPTHGEAGSRP